jgi:hypothetical protein
MEDFNFKKAKQQLLSEIKVNKPGGPRIYVGEPNNEFFKIINFPAIPNKNIELNSQNNLEFKEIINKIKNYINGITNPKFNFYGDFSKPNKVAYIHTSPDILPNHFNSNYYIASSLNEFGEDFKTEEDFRVQNWKEI